MDTLRDVISDVSSFLYGGIVSLPLTLAGTMLVIGLFTAHYAMLFFLVGFLLLAPSVHWLLNRWIMTPLATDYFPSAIKRTADVCGLVIPFMALSNSSAPSQDTHVVSQWVAMMAFFFGYLLRNAMALFSRKPEESTEVQEADLKQQQSKVNYRRTQAAMSIGSILLASTVLLVLRYQTGCESLVGMMTGTVILGLCGYFWYDALRSTGQDRLSDLFGVANRLLPPSALAQGPVACMKQVPAN